MIRQYQIQIKLPKPKKIHGLRQPVFAIACSTYAAANGMHEGESSRANSIATWGPAGGGRGARSWRPTWTHAARSTRSRALSCVTTRSARVREPVCCHRRAHSVTSVHMPAFAPVAPPRPPASLLHCGDENGSDTYGYRRYRRYHICFYISGQIRIRIRIMSIMSDKIRLDVDIINIRFKYSDTDTVSNVEYSDSDTDRSEPL